jgi:hypothetical protein
MNDASLESIEYQFQSARTANRPRFPIHGIFTGQSKVGNPSQELFNRDPQFHPGQMCPETAVHASTKSEVSVW